MNARFEPPSIRQRGELVRATARAMHEASQALQQGQREGRLTCERCGCSIRWSGSGSRTAGSCTSAGCVRWQP